MSCEHDLANLTCVLCFPLTGDIDPRTPAADPGCCSDCHTGVPGGPCGCGPAPEERQPGFTVLNLGVHDRNIRRDCFGRIVMDTCDSDGEHLRFAEPLPGDDRPRCRELLEEMFAPLIGRRGTLFVSVVFADEITERDLEKRFGPLVETNRELLAMLKAAKPGVPDGG